MSTRTWHVSAGLAVLMTLAVGSALPAQGQPSAAGATLRLAGGFDGAPANGDSSRLTMSADGRHVTFLSSASNLVPGDTNRADDVFTVDRGTGMTTRVSLTPAGEQFPEDASGPVMSADGRFVAFAANRIFIYLWDRETRSTSIANVGLSGNPADDSSAEPSLSGDGRYVSYASNLVPDDTGGQRKIYIRDRVAGATRLVSGTVDGSPPDGFSTSPSISDDGRWIAYSSEGTNLVPDDTNRVADVFLYDRIRDVTSRENVHPDGSQAVQSAVPPVISPDGRLIAFISHEGLDGELVSSSPLWVRDHRARTTTRVCRTPTEDPLNGECIDPAFSRDGGKVALASRANNLIAGDSGREFDTFLHDLDSRQTTRVSVSMDGGQANQDSREPAVDADGSSVAFTSVATNLLPGTGGTHRDVYVRLPHAPSNPFGDFDGDGMSDILVVHRSTGRLLLYPGTGTVLGSPKVIGRSGWAGMDALTRLGDFTGDGRDDLIARHSGSGDLWLYSGNRGGFSSRIRLGGGWNAMREITAVGDLTGDGRPDVVAIQTATGNLFLYPGQRNRLGPRQLLGRGGWNGMSELTAVGDISRDGSPDLIARQTATGKLWLYRGAHAAALRPATQFGAYGWNNLHQLTGVGDYNRDGINDLAAIDPRGRLTLYRGRPTSLHPATPISTPIGVPVNQVIA